MILMMRIESLKTSADRSGRFWLTLDNGKRVGLYRQTVEDFGLYAGMELSEDQWNDIERAAGATSAKMRAVRIVAATNVSVADLQQRLVQKGESESDAAQAVAWMEEMQLVDDAETARQIVSRCAARGYGLQRAKQALYQKRIPKYLWEDALVDYPDQIEYILSFLREKLSRFDDSKEMKRAVDALLRRGHTYSEIRSAIRILALDGDEIPED